MPPVYDFVFDDENIEKLARHGITPEQVEQLLENRHKVKRNRPGRRAAWLLVGRDHGGKCITLPIEETDQPGRWRPVTGWYSKPAEEAWLDR